MRRARVMYVGVRVRSALGRRSGSGQAASGATCSVLHVPTPWLVPLGVPRLRFIG
jgi:hypothetical protein